MSRAPAKHGGYRPGAGRKPTGQARPHQRVVRLSDDELADIDQLAERWGVTPVGAIRRAVREAAARR